MNFENRLNSGSVRRLREQFEQNNTNLNNICLNNSKNDKINEIINAFKENESNIEAKSRRPKVKPILKNSFVDKLNKTLSNDNKNSLKLNLKSGNCAENEIVWHRSPIFEANLSPAIPPKRLFPTAPDYSSTRPPSPPPKPPRTFAHDIYLDLKFNKSKVNNNTTSDVNNDKLISDLYSVPNKSNKLKNRRLRSQSDSQVLDNKKTGCVSTETIYDDCIVGDKNCDKTFKFKVFKHFSCLKLK